MGLNNKERNYLNQWKITVRIITTVPRATVTLIFAMMATIKVEIKQISTGFAVVDLKGRAKEEVVEELLEDDSKVEWTSRDSFVTDVQEI
jgi:hypothetical protein